MRGYPRNRLTDRSGTGPVVTKTAQSRGYTISYEDAGVGPVIMLIPGATMSAADWRDAGYVDRLASTHRVLSVDPLGNGQSDKPHDPDAYAWPTVAAACSRSSTRQTLTVRSCGAIRAAERWRQPLRPSTRIGSPRSYSTTDHRRT